MAVTVGDLWLGSTAVEDDLAAFTAVDDVEGFFELVGWWVMIALTSNPLCSIAAILYQVSKLRRP